MNAISTSNTFQVSNVELATEPLPEVASQEAIAQFLDRAVESCSHRHANLVANVRAHPLIAALHAGFATHRPVSLSPDAIWLTLCQGLAHHVNANSEALRSRLVRHEGKLKLEVRRDEFVKGSLENDWPGVFSEFSAAIRDHLGDTHALILADFSTTGPVERAASEVVLLDTMQGFFIYEALTFCGIPSITLEGTPQDWREIARRVREFSRFDLDWWIEPLQPILEEFVAAAEGDVDHRFWDSIYKWQGSSGSASVSGWIVNLFPYLENLEPKWASLFGRESSAQRICRNKWLSSFRRDSKWCLQPRQTGPGRDDFPSLPAKAPFLWRFSDDVSFQMEFIGGLIGISQDSESLSLRPEIGWAVCETPESNTPICTVRIPGRRRRT